MDDMSIVYVLTDTDGWITDVSSGEFLRNTEGWTEIDRGYGDKFFHAQNNYLPKSIQKADGTYRYKLMDGVPVDMSDGEGIDPVTWTALAAAYKEGVDEA